MKQLINNITEKQYQRLWMLRYNKKGKKCTVLACYTGSTYVYILQISHPPSEVFLPCISLNFSVISMQKNTTYEEFSIEHRIECLLLSKYFWYDGFCFNDHHQYIVYVVFMFSCEISTFYFYYKLERGDTTLFGQYL